VNVLDTLAARAVARALRRPPDFVIGGHVRPYLLRWYITPWRRWFRQVEPAQRRWWQRLVLVVVRCLPNVYVHQFRRSDDDRAHHDHPWLFNVSWVLHGKLLEHTIAAGGIHHRRELSAGDWRFRWGRAPHRIELHDGYCWTLFITGPVVRAWGFHCAEEGWIPWERFTQQQDSGAIGLGCRG
jgi:hypothetical protein